MVTTAELIADLAHIGAQIAADGVRAPKRASTRELRSAISQHEPVLKLMYQLRMGQRWLSEQYERFYNGDPGAAADEFFSRGLDTWIRLEEELRRDYRYQGCIHGPSGVCPEEVPARCEACGGGRSLDGGC